MPERAPRGAQTFQQSAPPPQQGLAHDYAAIEATLRDSPLGRWFLAEYARRSRTPETQLLLDAIARLEAAVLKPQRQNGFSRILAELADISAAITRTRREIAQLRPPPTFDKRLSNASEELDQIVEATETATSEILSEAEDVQEVAWTLREKGVDPAFCDRLDRHAIDIYTACSFQDITGQRTAKVVRLLRHVEQRIHAMIGASDGGNAAPAGSLTEDDDDLLNGPPKDGEGLKQHDVDAMLTQGRSLAEAAPKRTAPSPTAPGLPEGSPEPESGRFERPEPLTLSELHAVKRAALFG
jgi:chemotaxis regulatin CheY-phosphate phosphatase CheZ